MKIVFPKKGFTLVCEVCLTPLGCEDNGYSEDGDCEDYWCDKCVDFRGGLLKVNSQTWTKKGVCNGQSTGDV